MPGKTPPGPRGHFLTGSLPEFRRDMLGFFTRCAREYGDVSAFSFFHIRGCLVNNPELIQEVLVSKNDRMAKPWDVRELKLALGEGLLTNEGESWRRQRQLIQPAFHHERVRHYAEIMSARAKQRADAWPDGSERDLHAEMMGLTLEIVAEALFGVDISPHVEAVDTGLSVFMRQFEAMLTGPVPLSLKVPTPGNLRARRAIRRLHRIISDIIERRRSSRTNGNDLLACLLAAQDDEGSQMNDRQVRDEVTTLLLAGHETTAIALSWTLYLLARHPEVEARLGDELDSVLGGRRPRPDDVPRLTFTRQVVQEAMRLYPPAWGIAREAIEEIELGGHTIPRGTQIFMVQYVTHRDPRFFAQPEEFRPDRWSPAEAKKIPKYAYFPFGGGSRHCIGSSFAMMEATLLLAVLMQRCRFELVPQHPIELQPAVTLRPRHGIRAVVRRR